MVSKITGLDSRRTKLLYIPSASSCNESTLDPNAGRNAGGAILGGVPRYTERNESDIIMVDPFTGEVEKKIHKPYPNHSAALTTAGGLLFTGFVDGSFAAYDDTSLEQLWEVNVGVGFNALPMTFEVGGKQYCETEGLYAPDDLTVDRTIGIFCVPGVRLEPILRDCSPAGKLRVGMIAITVLGGVADPVAKFIGSKLAVTVEPVMYPNLGAFAQSFGKNEWDIAIGPRALASDEKADSTVDVWPRLRRGSGKRVRGYCGRDKPGVKIGTIQGPDTHPRNQIGRDCAHSIEPAYCG